jgi:hypothetical protein
VPGAHETDEAERDDGIGRGGGARRKSREIDTVRNDPDFAAVDTVFDEDVGQYLGYRQYAFGAAPGIGLEPLRQAREAQATMLGALGGKRGVHFEEQASAMPACQPGAGEKIKIAAFIDEIGFFAAPGRLQPAIGRDVVGQLRKLAEHTGQQPPCDRDHPAFPAKLRLFIEAGSDNDHLMPICPQSTNQFLDMHPLPIMRIDPVRI